MDSAAIFAAVQSHAQGLGIFDHVNTHPAMNPPGNHIVASIGLGPIRGVGNISGLAATSGVVTLLNRVYRNIQTEPQDQIDIDVLKAVDLLFAAYSGDFELGGLIRNVDLLGQTGTALSAQPGWLQWPDGGTYRTVDITLPLIVSDIWSQAA
jgi:hypothetical protein